MKTFIRICKDVGGVYWRYKKNRRASVYHIMADPIATWAIWFMTPVRAGTYYVTFCK